MAQTLTTNIVINATAGNGFSDIGNTLTQLGAQVDSISEKLIGFGKDSLKVYQDYETSLSNTRGVLGGTLGKDTKELDDAMAFLDMRAREWAASSRFHLQDVGEAIDTAVHASWSVVDIDKNMAAAMELANAGSMDLSDAIMRLVTAQRSLGIENADIGEFIDMWAYASTQSVGDIESFGDTLDALGSVGRFADTNEELFAMIGLMHDMGTSGSAAATLLRTTWMRLLAPSGVASLVLEQLGATDEEINSIREDASLLETLDLLGSMGFSPYDAKGQAKPLIDTFVELRDVLAEIAGGYENIGTNQTTLGILNTLFGMRGIKGALNMFNDLEHAIELRDDLLNGKAAGYGEYYSATMMDTLWGKTMIWESKVENLKGRTGETLAAQIEPVMETVGGIVDKIAELDTGEFNALVTGLEVIAGLGPGLLLAGGGFRFLGNMLALFADPTTGAIAATTLAIAGLAELMTVMNEFEKADYADQFGDMGLDQSQVNSYVKQLSDDFSAAYENVTFFRNALDEAVQSYTNASSTFKSSLITDMLNGVDVSEGTEEYAKLVKVGEQIISALEAGVQANYDGLAEGITETMGGEESAASNPIWAQIMEVLYAGYEGELARAREWGTNLRNALTEAIGDGHLTGDEISRIQSLIDEGNELLAQQQDREHYLERQRILRKAQTLGLDTIHESAETVQAERDAELETLLDRQAGDLYDTMAMYDRLIENGGMVPNTDGTPGEHVATKEDREAARIALEEAQKNERDRWTADAENWLLNLYTEGITSSYLSDAWAALETLGMEFGASGGILTRGAAGRYRASTNVEDAARAHRYLADMVDALGGLDMLEEYADYFDELGDSETSGRFRNLANMLMATNGALESMPDTDLPGINASAYNATGSYDQIMTLIRGMYGDNTSITPAGLLSLMRERGGSENWYDVLGGSDLYWGLGSMAQQMGTSITGLLESVTSIDTTDAEAGLDSLQAKMDGMAGPDLVTTLDTSAVDNYQPTPKYLDIITRMGGAGTVNAQLYADGGRANAASIFAEDGPEWAIPEEHSDRTAELLNAARAASGFTWPDLISRFGGLGANANNVPHTLVYSPTIYAQNAEGVEQTLAADKTRLDRWYAEKQMMDSVEVYA